MLFGVQHPADVRLERVENFQFRIQFGSDFIPELITDEPLPLGRGLGPNPAKLLAAAVGNCLAASMLFCLGKARLEVRALEAEVRITTGRNPEGRVRITGLAVRLIPTVMPEVAQKMARCLELFESFCMVTESVRAGIPIAVHVSPRVQREGLGVGTPTHAAPAMTES